jgi:hypothetical protein
MSADIIDDANDLAEKHLADALAIARAKPKEHVQPTHCLNDCGEAVTTSLYCSADCMEDRNRRLATQRKQVAR